MRANLKANLPQIFKFFNKKDFENVLIELDKYDKNVKKHYNQFVETQEIWKKISSFLEQTK